MSTNYYVKKKVSEAHKAELRQAFEQYLTSECTQSTKLYRLLEKSSETIHLGKLSNGWQFLWDHNNGKTFDLNLGAIERFVKEECDNAVFDERGYKYTWEGFIEYIGEDMYKGFYGETYNRWVLEQPVSKYTTSIQDMCRECLSMPKIQIPIRGVSYTVYCGDFQTEDGLRFSKESDFE